MWGGSKSAPRCRSTRASCSRRARTWSTASQRRTDRSSTSCARRLRNDGARVSKTDAAGSLDEATFEALYLRLERALYNAAYRYVWHTEDAHDVVQEAFVKIWDARARIRV